MTSLHNNFEYEVTMSCGAERIIYAANEEDAIQTAKELGYQPASADLVGMTRSLYPPNSVLADIAGGLSTDRWFDPQDALE